MIWFERERAVGLDVFARDWVFVDVSDVLSFRKDEECIISAQAEYVGDECCVARCNGERLR